MKEITFNFFCGAAATKGCANTPDGASPVREPYVAAVYLTKANKGSGPGDAPFGMAPQPLLLFAQKSITHKKVNLPKLISRSRPLVTAKLSILKFLMFQYLYKPAWNLKVY